MNEKPLENERAAVAEGVAATPLTHELELKFTVPADEADALAEQVRRLGGRAQRMAAQYVDTADGRLAGAKMALRMRREGSRWVQTLKGAAGSSALREEHSVRRALRRTAGETVPPIDPALHAESGVGARLMDVLGLAPEAAADGPAATLVPIHGVDVRRLAATWQPPSAAAAEGAAAAPPRGMVELAFDRGEIRAAGQGPGEGAQVCELEIEWKGGSPMAILDAAQAVMQGRRLWLSASSKAERGERLARGARGLPVVKAAPMKALARGERRMDAHAFLRRATQEALDQIVRNGEAVAAGPAQARPEHLHQMRVGLRRLRSVWRELGLRVLPDEGAQVARIDQVLGDTARTLGAWRDRDAVFEPVQARLEQAEAPPLPDLAAAQEQAQPLLPEQLATQASFQHLLVELTLWAAWPGPIEAAWRAARQADGAPAQAGPTGEAAAPAPGAQPSAGDASTDRASTDRTAATRVVAKRLGRLHERIQADARSFLAMETEDQHRVRKRIKRLRYLAEFAEPLYTSKAQTRRRAAWMKALAKAQEALGEYQDEAVAAARYREEAARDPNAWYAVGWLKARQQAGSRFCAEALKEVAEARPFWD